jgi:hypothetical protein
LTEEHKNEITVFEIGPHHTVTENMCMSKHWKVGLVAYGIHLQPMPRFTHILLLKPDRSHVGPVCPESIQYLVLTSKPRSYQTVHPNGLYK